MLSNVLLASAVGPYESALCRYAPSHLHLPPTPQPSPVGHYRAPSCPLPMPSAAPHCLRSSLSDIHMPNPLKAYFWGVMANSRKLAEV